MLCLRGSWVKSRLLVDPPDNVTTLAGENVIAASSKEEKSGGTVD